MSRFAPGRIPPPSNPSPLIARLVELMNSAGIGCQDLCQAAGVSASSIHAWRTRSNPTVNNLEAVLNALGYELTIRKQADV